MELIENKNTSRAIKKGGRLPVTVDITQRTLIKCAGLDLLVPEDTVVGRNSTSAGPSKQ